jgi:RNA polymerase sigma factor (sigma-70 family)
MATKTARALAQVLRSCAQTAGAEVTDRELLRRFAEGDQTAFTALVRRHADMVYGVCRRAVPTAQDAEDVCQATFLVLAQKAGRKGWQASVANWLYATARRIAARARLAADRRRRRERKAARPEAVSCLEEMTGRELLAMLDEELDRLPVLYREPLVLCYLQGLTHDQGAARLGVPLATLKSRVDRGRKKLGQALTRRGCGLGAGLLALAVASRARASSLRLIHAILATVSTTPPATVAVLAQGVTMHALLLKPKLAILVVAAVSAVAVGLGAMNLLAANQQAEPAPPARVAKAGEPLPAEQATKGPMKDDKGVATLAGRVLGPDGKPVAGADVAVLAWQVLHQSYQSSFEDAAWQRGATPGCTEADAEGKFRLTIKVPPGPPQPTLRVLAGAKGLGIAWALLDPKAESAEVELRLPAEQVVRGRVVDLQGEPVAGARVLVTGLKHHPAKGEKDQGTWGTPPERLPFGPVSTTTNAKGEFTFRGLGNNLTAEVEVHDDRVELHTFTVKTSDKKQAENVKVALAPGRVVEGRVIYADTGKPVAGARVMIESAGGGRVRGLTDKDGRYRLNVRRRELPDMGGGAPFVVELVVSVFAPPGEPYWMKMEFVDRWVKGATRRETNVALPRGVLLRGKITEAGTGKPVAGAEIDYKGQVMTHRWRSGADGSYAFVLPADAARPLTVNGPSPDYIPQVVGSAELLTGKKGGAPIYHHAVVPLGLKPGDREKELPIELRRGVTLKGRLVGPDGKPAKDAILLVGGYKPPREKFLFPIQVRDGHFELPGCDPDKSYHLVFVEHPWLNPDPSGEEDVHDTYGQLWLRALLGPQMKLGVAVDVSAKKAAAEPVEVRLASCGSAKLRFVDGDGKPLARYRPWLHLVVTGGPPVNQAIKDGKLAAEAVMLIHPLDAEPYADADGVLKVEGLIPGATYRIQRFDGEVIKEFKVEPGKTIDLDVPVP